MAILCSIEITRFAFQRSYKSSKGRHNGLLLALPVTFYPLKLKIKNRDVTRVAIDFVDAQKGL